MKKLLSILLLLPSLCWAAPDVSGVSGTMSDGQPIIITGSGFGDIGPTVQVFDSFEGGSNGTTLSNVVRQATIGQWEAHSEMNPNYPTYSSNAAHSGSLALRSDWGSGTYDGGGRLVDLQFSSPQTEVYLSYWAYQLSNIPGTTGGNGANLKLWWLSSDGVYGSDYGMQITSNTSPFGIAFGTIDGGEDRCGGSSGVGDCQNTIGYDMPSIFTRGRWVRIEAYMHGTTANTGIIQSWLMDSVSARAIYQEYTGGDNTLYSGDSTGWQHIHFPGYGRDESGANTYYDDIYVATGAGARARVEIGNASTYSACTNLAVITPTSWSATSIEATVRAGSFTTGTAYLYVTDASGVTGPAETITLGASQGSGGSAQIGSGGAAIGSGGGRFN